ncbi:MAG: PQQ-dependent sugar dehydrogenase [Aliarcobacter sp.]|nr:PQQ-dependent sugar dehydrogenase [Aliarcobacter sp.]
MHFIYLLLLLPILIFSKNIQSKSEDANIDVEKIASNLGVVWGMSFISDDELLFTVKTGKIGVLNIKTKKINYLSNPLNTVYSGQGGLLDVQKSPNFSKDKQLFFTYVKQINGKSTTALASAKLQNNKLIDWKDLFISKAFSDTTRHFGSRITFDEKAHLFFSIGDRGVRENSQNLSNHAGTIIRLNLDGSIPSDNPFVNNKDAFPEIYSFGHRNPQGIFYDKKTDKLYSSEHGPRGGDEINIVKKGENYGWPIISYGKEYWNDFAVGESTHKEGMQQPIKYYIPSIAPSSLIVYDGEMFKNWKGNLFLGALKLMHLNRIVLDKDNNVIKEEKLLQELEERIRNVIQSSDGKLYISSDSGNIYALSSKD